jgi:hypothetical protein
MELPASLEKKLGPLPVWAWGAVVGGAFLAITLLKGGTSTSGTTTAATAPAATSGGDTTGGSSGILGSGDTTAPITGGSGSGTPSDPPTSEGFTLTDPTTWPPTSQPSQPTSQPSQPVAATPKTTDPTNGAGAAGPSLALPQTVVKAQTATPYVGAASQPQMVASAAPAVKAVVALPVGSILNSPSLTATPAQTGASGLTLAQWEANVAARSPGATQSAIAATAQRDFAGTPAAGTSGGGTFQAPAQPNPLNSQSLTGNTTVITPKGTAGGGVWAPNTVIAAPAASAPTPVPHAAKL